MNILHIDSSILGDASVTRTLSAELAARFARAPGATTIRRDLALNPLRHLSGDLFAARAAAEDQRSDDQKADIAESDAAMDEFLAADVVIIGAPMYNFSIPSQLKAWIDRIAVAGKTFRYGPNGPEGLAGGKKVIIVSSRGGIYSEGPAAAMDFQEQYLKTVLGFLGVTDVEFIRAEGVNFGPEQRAEAVSKAMGAIGARELPLAA